MTMVVLVLVSYSEVCKDSITVVPNLYSGSGNMQWLCNSRYRLHTKGEVAQ